MFFKNRKEELPFRLHDAEYIGHIARHEQQEMERSFARLFSTEEGRKVLAWLQVMTFHRAGNASTSGEQLRFMEGQRHLMASILRMIDRGRGG
ncbi:MAG: hypothetical protein WC989_04670 [Micavibrio sp.]